MCSSGVSSDEPMKWGATDWGKFQGRRIELTESDFRDGELEETV